jgi:outer membrane protein OmpA-like peptidoglycan-associated protein
MKGLNRISYVVFYCVLSLLATATMNGQTSNWSAKTERTVNGSEADLVVRTGDINNLGFGWPQGFDPFSGKSTPTHNFPWDPRQGEPEGTDRILLGSNITREDQRRHFTDLYSGYALDHRSWSMPVPITLNVGALPAKVNAVLIQMFLDDFQAPVWGSHFQVSVNGTRIPSFEVAVNSLRQTGPIGKLVTLKLLPEYWPLLNSGKVQILIDDPTTHIPDGYAIDFVRILVNPKPFKYTVSLNCSVVDAITHRPIAQASIEAANATATTDARGHCALHEIQAGMVTATAIAPGYDEQTIPVDLEARSSGIADFKLTKHREGLDDLQKQIDRSGIAAIYGVHFDTGSAKLKPDSEATLKTVLQLINRTPDARWTISGHTDNQGTAAMNQKLSEQRAESVIAWLGAHGVNPSRLTPEGYGPSRPVADNGTEAGRALNRRVEIGITK